MNHHKARNKFLRNLYKIFICRIHNTKNKSHIFSDIYLTGETIIAQTNQHKAMYKSTPGDATQIYADPRQCIINQAISTQDFKDATNQQPKDRSRTKQHQPQNSEPDRGGVRGKQCESRHSGPKQPPRRNAILSLKQCDSKHSGPKQPARGKATIAQGKAITMQAQGDSPGKDNGPGRGNNTRQQPSALAQGNSPRQRQ